MGANAVIQKESEKYFKGFVVIIAKAKSYDIHKNKIYESIALFYKICFRKLMSKI